MLLRNSHRHTHGHYTNPVSQLTYEDCAGLIKLALLEDAPAGDVTSEAIFAPDDRARATIVSREDGVLSGLPLVQHLITIYKEMTGSEIQFHSRFKDGQPIAKGDRILELEGTTRALLRTERIILNFLQYLSGIATRVNDAVKIAGQLKIVDTRKTLPGYRRLAKYAVYCGGGINHRISLSDMILIKDNHVAAAGGIRPAILKSREAHPEVPLEIEVDTLDQLKEALELLPDYVLLDNMDRSMIQEALKMIHAYPEEDRPVIEVSGGWRPSRLHEIEDLGPLQVSMGFLTGETRLLDFSMEIIDSDR